MIYDIDFYLTGDSSILSVRYGFAHLVHILQFAIYILSVNSWCPMHTCEYALDSNLKNANFNDATRIRVFGAKFAERKWRKLKV